MTDISRITQADRAWWQQRAAAEHAGPLLAAAGTRLGSDQAGVIDATPARKT